MWLVILFSPIVVLAILGQFRVLIPLLKILPLHPVAKPMIGGAWALFSLLWLLLVHSCWAEGEPWSWAWKTMLWAIVGTLFVNQMCVWASSYGQVANKDIDGVIAGASLFYFISSLWLSSRFQEARERKLKSNQPQKQTNNA